MVSSILPQQLKTDRTRNEGPKLFKQYLEYAWEVSEGRFKPVITENTDHSPEWYLKSRLKAYAEESLADLSVLEELPFADLTVKEGEQYIGLVLTDDQRYFQAASAKDAHVYLPTLLNEKNWHFSNFFSREYWQNKDKVYEALNHFVSLHRPD